MFRVALSARGHTFPSIGHHRFPDECGTELRHKVRSIAESLGQEPTAGRVGDVDLLYCSLYGTGQLFIPAKASTVFIQYSASQLDS